MALLDIRNLSAAYGDVPVLFDVSLHVDEGEVVSLIGSNGAGKTTLLRAVSGLIASQGELFFSGEKISGLDSHRIVEKGIAHVPEGRQLFSGMTVAENLRLGLPRSITKTESLRRMESIYELFPRLKQRLGQIAGTLSGGEQQMVAIGRGLALQPRLLILDEPSLGLSPVMVQSIFETVQKLRDSGMTLLLVEQNVTESLKCSSRAYVMDAGHITIGGAANDLLHDPKVRAAFLGGNFVEI